MLLTKINYTHTHNQVHNQPSLYSWWPIITASLQLHSAPCTAHLQQT